jgi:hypothetical protein
MKAMDCAHNKDVMAGLVPAISGTPRDPRVKPAGDGSFSENPQ